MNDMINNEPGTLLLIVAVSGFSFGMLLSVFYDCIQHSKKLDTIIELLEKKDKP